SFVEKLVRLPVALVADGDSYPAVEERQLAQPLREDVEAEVDVLEDERVGLERDACAALIGDAGLLDRPFGLAAAVALLIDLAVPPDLHLERLGEGVDHRHAHAVEATRDLVGALVELPARMQLGEHYLRGRDTLGGVDVDGDASAVVLHGDARVDVDRDV